MPCTWTIDRWDQWDAAVWETSCGGAFEFSEDGPIENNFKFCPYCGKKLVQDRSTQGRMPEGQEGESTNEDLQ